MSEVAELLRNALSGGSVVALPFAAIGGIVAGLNPCCLPLYPAAAATCTAVRGTRTRLRFWSATAFALGLAVVTTILGVTAAMAGRVLTGLGHWASYALAAIPIGMGLHLLGWIRLPLPRPGRLSVRQGVLGAFLGGLVFSLVLAPCATPILASVLSYAAAEGNLAYGGLLLFSYGIGVAVPVLAASFLVVGLAVRLERGGWGARLDRITGAALVLLGLYLVWIA